MGERQRAQQALKQSAARLCAGLARWEDKQSSIRRHQIAHKANKGLHREYLIDGPEVPMDTRPINTQETYASVMGDHYTPSKAVA